MAEKSLDIALRIRTDLKQAVGEVDALENQLVQLGGAGNTAGNGLDKTASAAGKATVNFGRMTPAVTQAENGLMRFNRIANQLRNTMPGISSPAITNGIKQQSSQIGAATLSAKQYSQAMRLLPAQITDIGTSLAGGMPIWLIAIQQGGQIRDSFGGTREAAKALLSTVKPMPVIFGSIAAATLGLVIAHEQGAAEGRRFNEVLINTGNISGTSADSLGEMSRRLDEVAGTRRQASAALSEIAQTAAFTEKQIEQIGLTALQMQIVTGRAVGATVEEFVALSEDPVEAITKLNDQYQFLDASVYANIKALQDQGNEVEAIELAINTYADTMQQRADEVAGNLGMLERGWKAIKSTAAEGWDAMLGIGREATLQERLTDINRRIEQEQNKRSSRMPGRSNLEPLMAEKAAIEDAIALRDKEAGIAREKRLIENEAIQAMVAVDKLSQQNLTTEEKRVAAIKNYKEQLDAIRQADPNDSRLAGDVVSRNIAGINDRYADKEAEAAAKRAQREAERLAESQQKYVDQLERTANTAGKTAAEVRAYDLAEQQLAGDLQKRAQAAIAAIDAQEQMNKSLEDAKQLASIQSQIFQLEDNPLAARQIELDQQFSELRDRLVERGDEAGKAFVDKLIDLELARTRLGQVQDEIDAILSEQQRVEDSINVQQDAGLLNEVEARKQILDLHKQTATVLEQQKPLLEEIAKQPGIIGEQAAVALAQLNTEAMRLRTTTSELETTLKEGIGTGLKQAISGLAQGTMTLRDAIGNLLQSIGQALIDMAANQLVTSLFASGSGGGGFISAIAGFLGSGFSEGGWTGSGSKYEPAGFVHKEEYVQPQSVMRQPGALAFMESFRQHGMASLKRFRGYAEGGMVGAGRLPDEAERKAGRSGEMQLNQFIALDPQQLADSVASTPNFGRSIMTIIRAERRQVSTILSEG